MAWARSLVSRRGALDVREKREHGLRWWGPLGHERIDWPEVERARELSTAGCGDVERLPRRSCSWDKALGLRGRVPSSEGVGDPLAAAGLLPWGTGFAGPGRGLFVLF